MQRISAQEHGGQHTDPRHRRLNAENLEARMLLQVHDELALDVPKHELSRAETLLGESMEGASELDVPLVATMGRGRSWPDAH